MSVRNPCKNHPDREGKVYCQKYNRWYCGDCIKCTGPGQYCKFRTACMIWEFEKYGIPDEFREHHDEPTAPSSDEDKVTPRSPAPAKRGGPEETAVPTPESDQGVTLSHSCLDPSSAPAKSA